MGCEIFFNMRLFLGYVNHLIPYTGKDFVYSKKKGIGASVIELLLISGIKLPESYHVTFDSFFNSLNCI